ncbi:transcription elongation factor A protein 1-like [Polyodon spathula]|uniref:transcription elongation factor A protein 1-like n=1 Tax=Polyodon spathula TaxID=7913 RepID=UPI001B7F6824|nr:transcription elongation factor A protein 1-like [Polyodon spathula]
MGKTEEDEIIRIAKKMDKMAQKKNGSEALDLLKELKNIPMTLELLQSTRIGMSVNAIRKQSTDDEVTSLAKSLIKSWKKLLDEPGGAEKAPEEKKKEPASLPVPAPASCSQNSPEPREKSCLCYKLSDQDFTAMLRSAWNTPVVAAVLRTPAVMVALAAVMLPSAQDTGSGMFRQLLQVEVVSSPPTLLLCSLRLPFHRLPRAVMCRHPRAMAYWHPQVVEAGTTGTGRENRDDYIAIGADCEELGAQIEDCIFQEFKNIDMKYKNRVRSRIANLKDIKNPNLRRNVLCGSVAPDRMARMTAEDMASDELKEMRKNLTKEAIRDHQMAKTGGTPSDMFCCGKCKKRNCTYTQVQTRSADEPMTTFVFCIECGNRWKFC